MLTNQIKNEPDGKSEDNKKDQKVTQFQRVGRAKTKT